MIYLERSWFTLLLMMLVAACSVPDSLTKERTTPVKTIRFSGYHWLVKDGIAKGPGPNNWSKENVWVDELGRLHLKLTQKNGVWYCAEVETKETFLYGTFDFRIEGHIDKLDKNAVLACFTYPGSALDHHHEMDIEFSRWGIENGRNLHYTVWPAGKGERCTSESNFHLNASYSTHRFYWSPSSVRFQGLQGFTSNDDSSFSSAACTDAAIISNKKMPVLINLWLYNGNAPSNLKEIEVVIHSFSHKGF